MWILEINVAGLRFTRRIRRPRGPELLVGAHTPLRRPIPSLARVA